MKLLDAFVRHQLDLFRFEASVRNEILEELNKLGRDLELTLIRGKDLTTAKRGEVKRLLADITSVVDEHYSRAAGHMTSTLTKLARIESETVLYAALDAGLPSGTMLKSIVGDAMIQGAPSAEWWSKQAADAAFRFQQEVREGMIAGETNAQIVRRITGENGILDVPRKNAEALVRSSVQAVANDARLETFRQNSDVIKGIRQISTLDGRTSEICIAYSDQEWDLDGNPLPGSTLPFNGGPPRHWGCRSTLVPILASEFEFLSEGRTRASAEGPVSDKMSMEKFLERQPPGVVDEMLGKGKAQLWRDGEITLKQLVDGRGRPLTLAQLQERNGSLARGVRVNEADNVGLDSFRVEDRRRQIDRIEKVLEDLGMEDVQVVYHYGQGRGFEVAGQKMTMAAYWSPSRNQMGFYLENGGSKLEVVRHEAFHARFHAARMASMQHNRVDAPVFVGKRGRGAPSLADVRNFYESKSGNLIDDFIIKHRDALEREDGTTEYSKKYWVAWRGDKSSFAKFRTAVNESLAEMHASRKVTPTYTDLDRLVTQHARATYPKIKDADYLRLPTGQAGIDALEAIKRLNAMRPLDGSSTYVRNLMPQTSQLNSTFDTWSLPWTKATTGELRVDQLKTISDKVRRSEVQRYLEGGDSSRSVLVVKYRGEYIVVSNDEMVTAQIMQGKTVKARILELGDDLKPITTEPPVQPPPVPTKPLPPPELPPIKPPVTELPPYQFPPVTAPWTLEDICAELGMDPKKARKILRDNGATKPGPFWLWPNKDAASEIIDLLRKKKR